MSQYLIVRISFWRIFLLRSRAHFFLNGIQADFAKYSVESKVETKPLEETFVKTHKIGLFVRKVWDSLLSESFEAHERMYEDKITYLRILLEIERNYFFIKQ